MGKAALEERKELFIEKWEGQWPGRPPDLVPSLETADAVPSDKIAHLWVPKTAPGTFAAEKGEALRDDDDHANEDGAGLSMKPEFEATVEATDAPT